MFPCVIPPTRKIVQNGFSGKFSSDASILTRRVKTLRQNPPHRFLSSSIGGLKMVAKGEKGYKGFHGYLPEELYARMKVASARGCRQDIYSREQLRLPWSYRDPQRFLRGQGVMELSAAIRSAWVEHRSSTVDVFDGDILWIVEVAPHPFGRGVELIWKLA